MSICSLLSSTMLIMRDGEGKVLNADNMFYNTLSARQALRWHRRWSRRRPSTPTLMPPTCRTWHFDDDVDIPALLAERICYLYLDLICTASTWTIVIKQADLRQCQNALRGIYLLTTTLLGMWGRSNWHPIQGMKESHLADCIFLAIKPVYIDIILLNNWTVQEVYMHTKVWTYTHGWYTKSIIRIHASIVM